jgi:glycosyltransferase involved in cell wall biosynthesis
MKDICIITNYFPPETGAASNRINFLATLLSNKGYKVTVVCPLPNYPKGRIFKGYRHSIFKAETQDNINIHRLWLYATNSKNKWKRLFSMLSFSVSLVLYRLFKKPADAVIVQSPPLLIANAALRLYATKKRKVILNVSDLWPQAGLDLGALKEGKFYNYLKAIESYNYLKADVILGQSKEILDHINTLRPFKNSILYRNYPNVTIEKEASTLTKKPIKIIYAGLLGVAQGVLSLCKHIILTENIELHIYGEGSEKEAIKQYLSKANKDKIIFHGEITKSELHNLYGNHHIALVPLVRPILGSVPSKIFELAHFGFPLLYMAGGEGAQIVNENAMGYTIPPQDYNALNNAISTLNAEDLISKRSQIIKVAKQKFVIEKQLQQLLNAIEA